MTDKTGNAHAGNMLNHYAAHFGPKPMFILSDEI